MIASALLIEPLVVGEKVTLSVHLVEGLRLTGLDPHGVAPPDETPKLPPPLYVKV